MAANCDDHTKNFSFLLQDRRRWALAPAYDLIYAFNPEGDWTYQHLMSVNGRFQGIDRENLRILADRFEIGRATTLMAEVKDAVAAWPDFASRAGISEPVIERIRQNQRFL